MNTRKKPKSKYFSPNSFPKFDRNLNTLLASGLLLYGLLGLAIDDIYIPGRRTRGIHFHGVPMVLVFCSFLCVIVYLMAIVLDHYDRRNNEKKYALMRKMAKVLGWILFILACLADLFFYKLSTR